MTMPQSEASGDITLTVSDGTEMAAYVARPRGAAGRGLLLFQEAFGVNDHIRAVAQRCADEGYLTIAPELFHRTGPGFRGRYDDFAGVMPHMQALTVPTLEADVRAAHGWLTAAGLPTAPIAALGFCMGGRVACLAAATVPLAAAVSFYGGMTPALRERAGEMAAPLLLFWGGRDRHITAEIRRAFTDALTAADKDFTSVVFSHADHGFHCDERPSYSPLAAREAWTLTLAFLRDRLPVVAA